VPVQTLIEEGYSPEEAKTVQIMKGKVRYLQQDWLQGPDRFGTK